MFFAKFNILFFGLERAGKEIKGILTEGLIF
jgi:hypothetical protein